MAAIQFRSSPLSHRFNRDMGGSSFPGWYFLVCGQVISWFGVAGSFWLHYQDQRGTNQLRELFVEEPRLSRTGGLSQAAKLQPREPDPGWPGRGPPLEDPVEKSEQGPVGLVRERDTLETEKNFWKGLFFGGALVVLTLVVQWFLCTSRVRDIPEEAVVDPSSPVQTKQELAARQLAEVRLKKHGFDQ